MSGAVAVLDVGKTNVKLALFSPDGGLLSEYFMLNRVAPDPLYPHADVDATWAFLTEALRDANAVHRIEVIVPTTHACAGAFVDDVGLVLPVLDYEFAGVAEVNTLYASLRPSYSETLSPRLPVGLNQGRQIAWQKQRFPEAFARAKHYLTYPQYWSWRLTGVAASEVTYLGCHSDLWSPIQGRPSSLAAKLDLLRLMPPFRRAWDRLGPVKSEVAALTGLDPGAEVLCGVHDSNASLLAHLASRKAPFTIVSTGTWVILMAVGLGVGGLNEADDMLANVDVEGRPTACARFMGGREYGEIVGAEMGDADATAIDRVIMSGATALPSFAQQGGPFASRKGEIHGTVASVDRPALATLYIALMTDLMLTRLGAEVGDLIVEGSFAENLAYCGLLAALRPHQKVLVSGDSAGTARGAALLARWPEPFPEIELGGPIEPLSIEGLTAYRAAWNDAVQ